MSDVSTDDAIAICEAWFAHNEAARARSIAVQRLATMAREGDSDAARRGLANIDRAPLVFDGSRLEPAVRRLITEVATSRAAAEDATEYVLAQINRDLRAEVESLSLALKAANDDGLRDRAEAERLRALLQRVIGWHNAPADCYATGPNLGDERDFACPACEALRLLGEDLK